MEQRMFTALEKAFQEQFKQKFPTNGIVLTPSGREAVVRGYTGEGRLNLFYLNDKGEPFLLPNGVEDSVILKPSLCSPLFDIKGD